MPIEIGAAYIRVSTDDQTELSPDAQLRVIRDAAKADGYIIPEEYIFIESRGISGRKAGNRPEFQKMIATAKSQSPAPFSRLYVWKFSRFARNQEESVFYKSILRKKCCVDIKSVSEPITEGMFGRLIESIIEWFDEYYSVNLSGEVKRGMTEKALREGYQCVPSIGYRAVGEGKPFVIVPEEMKIVEFVHALYHEGKQITTIARECNLRGWLTKRGTKFERRTVVRILNNRFYVGDVTWNNITFHGRHELSPVVVSVFEDNQERLKREHRVLNRRDASPEQHWLCGMMHCGFCGSGLVLHRSSNPKRRPDMFQCWKYVKGAHEGSCSITVRKAEVAVLESIEHIINTGEISFERKAIVTRNNSEECDAIMLALSRLDNKERRAKEAYMAGIDTLEEYKEMKSLLKSERCDLEKALEEARDPVQEEVTKEEMIGRLKEAYDTLINPDLGLEEKSIAIRNVVQEIVFDRASGSMNIKYFA